MQWCSDRIGKIRSNNAYLSQLLSRLFQIENGFENFVQPVQLDISNQLIKSFKMNTYLPYLDDFPKIHYINLITYVVDFWKVVKVWQIGTQIEALDELV